MDKVEFITCWHPILKPSYTQLVFAGGSKYNPVEISENEYRYFRGDNEHRGNFNYTDKIQCAARITVALNEPRHPGFYTISNYCGSRSMWITKSSEQPDVPLSLNDLEDIATISYELLTNTIANREVDRKSVGIFVSKILEISPYMCGWYVEFLCRYSFWKNFLNRYACIQNNIDECILSEIELIFPHFKKNM